MSNYQGINDSYLPTISKPSLQQYDNYQIYTLVCIDDTENQIKIGNGFLAIQSFSIEPIEINFISLVNTYH
jgi:hypothetical protein